MIPRAVLDCEPTWLTMTAAAAVELKKNKIFDFGGKTAPLLVEVKGVPARKRCNVYPRKGGQTNQWTPPAATYPAMFWQERGKQKSTSQATHGWTASAIGFNFFPPIILVRWWRADGFDVFLFSTIWLVDNWFSVAIFYHPVPSPSVWQLLTVGSSSFHFGVAFCCNSQEMSVN